MISCDFDFSGLTSIGVLGLSERECRGVEGDDIGVPPRREAIERDRDICRTGVEGRTDVLRSGVEGAGAMEAARDNEGVRARSAGGAGGRMAQPNNAVRTAVVEGSERVRDSETNSV